MLSPNKYRQINKFPFITLTHCGNKDDVEAHATVRPRSGCTPSRGV